MRQLAIFLFFCCSFGWGQHKENELSLRMEKGTDLFRAALIKHFIHPTQLDQQNWQHCLSSIRLLLEKEEEDFVEVRFDQAFKNADAPNYFSPIFVYADGRAYTLPTFKIMQ